MTIFYISNSAGGAVTAAQAAAGTAIAVLNRGSAGLQRWVLTADGHLTLADAASDLCLSVPLADLPAGGSVTLAARGASGYLQQWDYDATAGRISLSGHAGLLLADGAGGPAGPVVSVMTASQTTWRLRLSTLPQPMIGMNWEPAPSDYTELPAPQKYGDTDFANEDFQALWSPDPPGIGRNDLATISGFGCNTIKMYNWSVPAPDGYWMRNHAPFLAAAAQHGLGVIVPISNFFTGTAYNNRTGNKNPAGPPPSDDLAAWITQIVTEVYADGNAPGPAVLWAIGNEYDNSNNGAYGYCEAQDIAQIASLIMAAEASLGIADANTLPFTSPVTTAINPVNTGIQQPNPPATPIMGQYAIQALIDAFATAGIPSTRFVASINSYQTGTQLTQYDTAFAQTFPGLPWFYGELGWSCANGGETTQADNLYDQFSTILPLANAVGTTFLGACCFEFSDELWKGKPGSSETTFGIYTFASGATPPTAQEGDHAPVWGASYPVDAFVARKAVAAFTAALAGQPNPQS